MIKGLKGIIRPFCKKILIENKTQPTVSNKSQVDLYYESSTESPGLESPPLRLTMDFSIKTEINHSSNASVLANLQNTLQTLYLQAVPIENESALNNFLMLQEGDKINYLKNFLTMTPSTGTKIINSINLNINDYISISELINTAGVPQRILNIPIEINKFTQSSAEFLSYVYFLTIGPGTQKMIMNDTIGTEIVLRNGSAFNSTGYFVISKTFVYDGKESELTNAPVPTNKTFIDTIDDSSESPFVSSLIDPDTGESLNPNIPTDRNQQVNYLFGAPGDVWVGPVHMHVINSTTGRMMAGAVHDPDIPHPYLDFVIKENTKVVDFRSSNVIEDLFSFKSSKYETILASSAGATFTGQKRNKTIEEIVKQNSIFSEGKFSVRPVRFDSGRGPERTKDVLNFFFAMDKKALLKHTTKIPSLLESLMVINESFYEQLVDNINIFHFEILRYNKQTKETKVLLVANNDFSSYSPKKGFYFRNRTHSVTTEKLSKSSKINFYEFTDGEIDAYTDTNTYSYEVRLKFKDPLIQYLTDHLNRLRTILKDLDELLQKTSFMIKDESTQKFVTVYDRYRKELNPTFVQQSLNPPASPAIPLEFNFDIEKEIPLSVKNAIGSGDTSLNNLLVYFLAVKLYDFNNLNNKSAFIAGVGEETVDLLMYIYSSLRLSTTTPSLIEKVRSLFDLIRDRTEKLLSLYSTEQLVKKSSGFTTKDYLKSTGNTKNSETYVTELSYKFDNKINLSKTKDNFNWIEEAPHQGESGAIKTISATAYKSLVQNPNIINSLSNEGQENFTDEGLFSYSFLPYAGPATLELQKTEKINILTNYLQTIRKKLIHNITDTPNSVLLPELLATFGIRFNLSNKSKMNYIDDKNAYEEGKLPINSPLEDNFGSDFTPQPKPISEYEGYGFSTMKAPAFGSVEDSDYAWQGGRYGDYPYDFGLSLISLLTTNVYQRRDITYLKNKHLELIGLDNLPPGAVLPNSAFFAKKDIPYSVNLFSTNTMSDSTEQSKIFNGALGFFNGSDQLLYTSYAYYSYLVNLFGQVYYLRGFKQRGTGPGDAQEAITQEKFNFAPTAINNLNFIKDMDWRPLDLNTLDNIPLDRKLICKVEFFEGAERNDLLDKKVINMYKHYYNHNQLFYIEGLRSGITLSPPVTVIEDERTEVATPSLVKETRSKLNLELNTQVELTERATRVEDPEFTQRQITIRKAAKETKTKVDAKSFTLDRPTRQ